MYKNVIRPRLYHFATVAHQEEFKQLQEDNKKQAKRVQQLERTLIQLREQKRSIISQLEAENKELKETIENLKKYYKSKP